MGLIKGLIFDFDGLILDTEEPLYSAWSKIYTEHGVALDIDAWSKCLGSSEKQFNPISHLEGLLDHRVDADVLRNTARVATDRRILDLEPLPGIVKTLLAARQMGLKLAVASSSSRSWVNGHLKRLDLYHTFDAVICMEDVPEVKPAPDLFLAALSCLGLKPQEATVFEDSPNGITAAQAAGIFSIAIPNTISRELDISHANLVLNRIDEIPLEELLGAIQTAQVMGQG